MIKKEIVQKIIRETGWDLSGVIRPGLVDGFDDYEKWIKQNRHADMKWMENNFDKRKNSSQILPGCQSIIVLGASYFNNTSEVANKERAEIARYAWGDDYHVVLKKKLITIAEKINQLAGQEYQYKCYADTGPILEKNLAVMAGLGWQGKNSLIVNHRLGSYFFIATIFTQARIENYQEKNIGDCGSCRKCLDNCPTRAILTNRSIDCHRCISYQTIENRGEIPPEIKSKIGNRIFGCDICQEVCPWNRFARGTRMPELEVKNDRDQLTIKQLREMDVEEYQRLFRKSAVKRVKFAGLKRNVG